MYDIGRKLHEKNPLCNLLPWSTVTNNALYSDLFCILTKLHWWWTQRWCSRFQCMKLDVISYDGIWCGISFSLLFFWVRKIFSIFYCIDDKIKIISKHAICLPGNTVHIYLTYICCNPMIQLNREKKKHAHTQFSLTLNIQWNT